MDTIPFHFLMISLDLILMGCLYLRFSRQTISHGSSATMYYEVPVSDPSRKTGSKPSLFLDLATVVLCGFVSLCGIVVFAVVFRSNFGQCAVEGLTYHTSIFFLASAVFLFARHHRILSVLTFFVGLSIFALGFDMLVIEPYSLDVVRYAVETTKVKKPLRVVFVADIQTDRIGRHERRTLETIMAQKPDLILLGGDYLQYYPGTLGTENLPERFRALFQEIPLTAPLGVFAICGNIDPSGRVAFNDLFQNTGVEAIFQSEFIENLGGDQDLGPIDLAFLSMVDSIDGVGAAGLTATGNFELMVGHYPNYAIKDYRNSEKAPDLMLCGHTHGGQVALPFYGPIRVKFTRREEVITRDFLRGMKIFPNGSRLLISRGSGMERGWAPRVRFLCKPEISVIDIVPVSR